MKNRHGVKAKADHSPNPLWIIAIAMAIFFAAATLVVAWG